MHHVAEDNLGIAQTRQDVRTVVVGTLGGLAEGTVGEPRTAAEVLEEAEDSWNIAVHSDQERIEGAVDAKVVTDSPAVHQAVEAVDEVEAVLHVGPKDSP